MNTTDKVLVIVTTVLLAIIAMICCYEWTVWQDTTKRFQREAIERGFAEYNSTNGVWQWKNLK